MWWILILFDKTGTDQDCKKLLSKLYLAQDQRSMQENQKGKKIKKKKDSKYQK